VAVFLSFSGSIIGASEVILLPLDVLKIKVQTNPAALGDGTAAGLRFAITDIRSLYAVAGATALTNIPESFALFFGAEAVYQVTKKEQKKNNIIVLCTGLLHCVVAMCF
jgi:hypothetical protein